MSTVLNVYLCTDRVGQLWLDNGRRFIFKYDPDWLDSDEQVVPLSLTLPLRSEVFPDDQARPFFTNLLPESDLRRVIANKLGLSEQNDFALLEAVGGECAGAVSVLPAGIPLPGASGVSSHIPTLRMPRCWPSRNDPGFRRRLHPGLGERLHLEARCSREVISAAFSLLRQDEQVAH